MNRRRLNKLHLARGRLLERIATQRQDFAAAMVPVAGALATTDRIFARVRSGIAYVKAHPSLIVIATAMLFVFKAGRTLRWAKRGFIAWRSWRALKQKLPFLWARP
jgi:hypothetical protein